MNIRSYARPHSVIKINAIALLYYDTRFFRLWGQGGCRWGEVVYNGVVVGDSGILDLLEI